ncbi:MAG: ATP-binding protein, partial [Coriobacteriales bacterium]|nr:ATP-binding protein [Coriobacteriales bacterium]
RNSLKRFPVTAIVGARQTGKSTLAKKILAETDNSLYLDLERPSDLARLENAELFLTAQRDKLICIDEIQRAPELFPLLRSLSDEWEKNGSFLILGSASRDLLKQSSESLAGRIAYHTLNPFLWQEVNDRTELADYLVKGGFPPSLLSSSMDDSLLWRENFITTFLERDLPQWSGASPQSIRRLWTMLAHSNGETANYSRLGNSLGLSDTTIRNYLDVLASTYMVEVIRPYHSNLGKRMVKAPKIYIADSGITTALLGLRTWEDVLGHPSYGALWEQVVLRTVRGALPKAEIFHYRTQSKTEADFVIATPHKLLVLECKGSLSPVPTKGNHYAISDISPDHAYIVSPVKSGWPIAEGFDVISLDELTELLS